MVSQKKQNMREVCMGRIKSLRIEGFKKFSELVAPDFDRHMNIFVGENEAGKSTILEAIKIVLNQQYKTADKAALIDLFNLELVTQFKNAPSIDTLPFICIELCFDLDDKAKDSEYFYGERNKRNEPAFGISFECRFNRELGNELAKDIADGKIPYEYYSLSWTTFAGHQYYLIKRPFNFLVINPTSNDTNSSFNYFNRSLFATRYDESTRLNVKHKFREGLATAFADAELEDIDANRRFGISDKKILLESIISVYEDLIPLENKGSGMESLIKTQIALDKPKSKIDVILMKEPENHLSHQTMNKMLHEISKTQSESQIIITTHSNLIASRLNLKFVKWITNNAVISLKGVNDPVADFFVKADNNNFLQLLLSQKVILVEGASEALLLPKIYSIVTKRTLEEDGVSIISCGGITYKNYLDIAVGNDKRIAVITDNDKNQERIDDAAELNKSSACHKVFIPTSVDDWTWEVCLYKLNTDLLNKTISVKENRKYLYNGTDYGQVLGKMLNNKVEVAYDLARIDDDFEVPQYVKDAIGWLNE